MIVIGVDVHKQSVTAVAIDEAGRPLAETVVMIGSDRLGGGARRSAVVGGRGLPAADALLERQLLELGEQLVRVPPKLTVPERRAASNGGATRLSAVPAAL